jgi:hypothetical protein
MSKNSLLRLIDQAMNGIFSFTNVPMRIAFLTMLYAVFAFVGGLLNQSLAPRGIMTVIVALFFFSGVQLMFIGILGEYITAIHSQVRRGPIVVEREKININTPAAQFEPSKERSLTSA